MASKDNDIFGLRNKPILPVLPSHTLIPQSITPYNTDQIQRLRT